MREIKARVWDNTCKCWLKDFVIYKQGNVSSDEVWLQKKEAIIELYTGLKDKNGKEIYEGDIVVDEYMERGYVHYADDEACYLITFNSGDVSQFILDKESEVIGNIHENPELV